MLLWIIVVLLCTCHGSFNSGCLKMNSLKNLLDWTIQTMQGKAKRMKEMVHVIDFLVLKASWSWRQNWWAQWMMLLMTHSSARRTSLGNQEMMQHIAFRVKALMYEGYGLCNHEAQDRCGGWNGSVDSGLIVVASLVGQV
jgi:hypothetical protein